MEKDIQQPLPTELLTNEILNKSEWDRLKRKLKAKTNANYKIDVHILEHNMLNTHPHPVERIKDPLI